jgi:hypothetical protein
LARAVAVASAGSAQARRTSRRKTNAGSWQSLANRMDLRVIAVRLA